MMNRAGLAILICITASASTAEVNSPVDQARLDHLLELAKESCLVNKKYQYSVNANGDVSIRNLEGKGEVKANILNDSGAVGSRQNACRSISIRFSIMY